MGRGKYNDTIDSYDLEIPARTIGGGAHHLKKEAYLDGPVNLHNTGANFWAVQIRVDDSNHFSAIDPGVLDITLYYEVL